MPIPGGAPSGGLVDLAGARAELNQVSTVSDVELQSMIDRASAILLNHPDYRIADVITPTVHTEWFDGIQQPYGHHSHHGLGYDDQHSKILLRHYPVSPDSITVTEYQGTYAQTVALEPTDGSAFTGYGWRTDDGTGASGILVRTSGGYPTRWVGRVKVVYSTGLGIAPADIQAAALLLIDHLWETQRGGQGSGLPPGLEVEPQGGGPAYGPGYLLPNRVLEALAAYARTPVVA